MATSASTFMEYQFLPRFRCLLKWALRSRLYQFKPVNVSNKTFAYRMHRLAEHFTDFDRNVGVITTALQALSYGQEAIALVIPVIQDFNQPCGQLDHERRLMLIKLQTDYLTQDKRTYEDVIRQAHEQFPGNNTAAKTQRKNYLSANWQFDTVPPKEMTPLPMCHTRAAFVTYNKKVLEEVFPELRTNIEGPWGWSSFMAPFSKEANIPCLRSGMRYAKSEQSMIKAMKRIHSSSQCPWMVACSFQTDGIQMKLLLHTSEQSRPGVSGLINLDKAGYVGDFKSHTLSDIIDRGVGVYPMKKVIGQSDDIHDVNITSIDPGQVLVIDGPRSAGQDFNHENVQRLIDLPETERCSYSSQEYKIRSLQLYGNMREALRRKKNQIVTNYGTALDSAPRRKTSSLDEFVTYSQYYAQNQAVIWKELLDVRRKHQRFSKFRVVQSAVEHIAERIAPMRDKGKVRRLIFFGTALIAAAKGAAGTPSKKIVRALCQRAAVIATPEAWTSQTCPGCSKRLEDGPDYRTKLCTTVNGCPLHETTPSRVLQRDAVGSLNIGFRGIRSVTGLAVALQPVNLVV